MHISCYTACSHYLNGMQLVYLPLAIDVIDFKRSCNYRFAIRIYLSKRLLDIGTFLTEHLFTEIQTRR